MDTLNTIKYLIKNHKLEHIDWSNGVFVPVDKPKQWTSFDVVNKIRYRLKHLTGKKKFKVGHAGTLDPLATGLLIIGCGKATKAMDQVSSTYKRYTGVITLGGTTPTFDAEMHVEKNYPIDHISSEMISNAEAHFTGSQSQIPPIYSAIKKNGKPLYIYARKGEGVTLEPRPIEISELQLVRESVNTLSFNCLCSKGTYIRSLAHDIGKYLDSGAYLSELCRETVGEFKLKDAWNLDVLIEVMESQKTDTCR